MVGCRNAGALAVLVSLAAVAAHTHDCAFDEIQRKIHGNDANRRRELHEHKQATQEYGRVADSHGRILQGNSYAPIRLKVDTSMLERNA